VKVERRIKWKLGGKGKNRTPAKAKEREKMIPKTETLIWDETSFSSFK